MPTRRLNHNWRTEDSSHEANRNTKFFTHTKAVVHLNAAQVPSLCPRTQSQSKKPLTYTQQLRRMDNHLLGTFPGAIGERRWHDRRSRTRDKHSDGRPTRRRAETSRVARRSSTRTIARIDEGGNKSTTAILKSTSGHHRRPVSSDFGQWLRVPQSRQDIADEGGRARVRGRARSVTQRFSTFPSRFQPPIPRVDRLTDREIDTRDTKCSLP